MKRFLSLFVAAFVLVTSIPRAAAVDVSGKFTATFGGKEISASGTTYQDWSEFTDVSFPLTSNAKYSLERVNTVGPIAGKLMTVVVPPTQALNVSGSVGVYFSWYIRSVNRDVRYFNSGISEGLTVDTYRSRLMASSAWTFYGYDDAGAISNGNSKSFDVTWFNLAGTSSTNDTIGMRFSGKLTTERPFSGVYAACSANVSAGSTVRAANDIQLIFPSFSIVATETSADLSALEGIADSITANNQIMNAMYGDIMSLLNSMYKRMGDMEAVETQAVSLLTSISSALGTLNTTTSNIYSVLSTYLHYLENIANTATSIDTELKQFHTDFIDRLDQIIAAINSESPDISDPTNGAQGAIDNFEQLEQGYISSMTDSFNSIDFGTTFDGGFVDGLTLYTNLFMEFWDALGVYAILYTIPLVLGLMLLIVGRVSPVVSPSGGSEGPPSRDSDTGLDVKK